MRFDEGDDGVYDWMLLDKDKLRKVRSEYGLPFNAVAQARRPWRA
jgi:hypothetical protein